ncbi:hypothetical protein BS78_08G147500 [Paspalum vaginatum]|nr:hypothetical protein BS78_08G147500 [Paspalum vaginatum]KAJ1266389.1 hypothetical protein BS78_08G147500 [Paspalum vaginatum]KAJ1266390.1 hypothetical protein BS78_08G147500 [Paspalum vaginatum]
MAETALAGLRWVASPIANKLIAEASAYLSMDMARELQELESITLPQFELVIEAAERSPHSQRGKLEKWLRDLKAAFYDAEDVLDEHEYNNLKRSANAEQSKRAAMVACGGSWPMAGTGRLANLRPSNRRLLRQVNVLKNTLAKAKSFRQELGVSPAVGDAGSQGTSAAPATTSFSTSRVLGRDKDRDHIIQFLTSDASGSAGAGIPSSAIVGLGGMGKSTLAQYVYSDKRVEEHFDVRMWVCISRKLDVPRHTREIIQSATKDECPKIDNLDTLQHKLRETLQRSERFLLVLDDVWFDGEVGRDDWELLLAPLALAASKQRGSRILVTSRRNVFPPALCCQQVFDLQHMDDSAFLALLREHAFAGVEIGDPRLRARLEEIAGKIAARLGKSPLAAKAVGSRLSRKKDIATWTAALSSDNLSEPMKALLWSYERLDPRLQRCFLYCSLYPKGHKYQVRELVHLWTAEGFIDLSSQGARMGDIGNKYLTELVDCSFLQPGSDRFGFKCLTMHDLLHDLAEKLSRDDCFRLEDDVDVAEIPCTVRHLSVCVRSMKQHKQSILKLRHLRTVICIGGPLVDDADDVFHQVLQHLKRLRVLYLCFYNRKKLPESVGQLKHLRYLNVFRTSITEFPASLCTLYHLQILLFGYEVQSLPEKLCNLSKLLTIERYASEFYGTQPWVPLPQIPYISKLTSLQHLEQFHVQKQKGYELRQLRDMNVLGGRLTITHLENVTGKDEAAEIMLHRKSDLTKFLELNWSHESGSHAEDSSHVDILEGLRPPTQLEALAIVGYKSDRYPSWLLQGSYFENLDFFRLDGCTALKHLPLNTELFKHCSRLFLENLPNLKALPACLPEGIKYLSIRGCPLLMFISSSEARQQDDKRENIMVPQHLVSRLCLIWEVDSEPYPEIKTNLHKEHSYLKRLMPLLDADISEHLQTISVNLEREEDKALHDKEIIIKEWLCCHEQRIKLLYGTNFGQQLLLPSTVDDLYLSSCSITNGALGVCLGSLTLLKELALEKIMTLTALPSEEVFRHLTALSTLVIISCWCLGSFGGLRAATSVTEVYIRCCPSLELARGAESMPPSLETLDISHCVVGADFFSVGFTHLKHLSMRCCRSSASLSIGHLSSLKSFELRHAPDLCLLEVEGFSSLQLEDVELVDVPKLSAGFMSQCRVQKSLCASSSDFINHLLSAQGCTGPELVQIQSCNETSISFEASASFTSVKELEILESKIQSLPKNMQALSSLEKLTIGSCPNILSLPDLPSSLRQITIEGCELLFESCQEPNGISWPKIAHIPWRYIRS